jgi:hypothetical protein
MYYFQSFIETRETVERLRKAEEKRAQMKRNEELAASSGTPLALKKSHAPMRRGSVQVTGSSMTAAAASADAETGLDEAAAAAAAAAASLETMSSPAPLPSRKPMRRASAFS